MRVEHGVPIEAVEQAKKYDTVVAYDLNYRASLWKSQGGKEGAQRINRNIAQYGPDLIAGQVPVGFQWFPNVAGPIGAKGAIPLAVAGDFNEAMKRLHTPKESG